MHLTIDKYKYIYNPLDWIIVVPIIRYTQHTYLCVAMPLYLSLSLSLPLYFTCTFIMGLGLSGGHSWIAIYIVLSAGWACKSRLVMGDTFAIIFQFRSAFEMQILSSGKKLFQQQNVLTKSDKIFHNLSTNHICCIYSICVCVQMCVYIDIYLLTFIIK